MTTTIYDSTEDTKDHIRKVEKRLNEILKQISWRKPWHDSTKLEDPEKPIFDEFTPKLSSSTYGSDEYKGFLQEMKVALDHHYKNNRHHPEHFKNGIDGITLIDLVEMLCDWKAATERHPNGDLKKSLEINKSRFMISDQLSSILKNTINLLKW
jgi:hypothetical protein